VVAGYVFPTWVHGNFFAGRLSSAGTPQNGQPFGWIVAHPGKNAENIVYCRRTVRQIKKRSPEAIVQRWRDSPFVLTVNLDRRDGVLP